MEDDHTCHRQGPHSIDVWTVNVLLVRRAGHGKSFGFQILLLRKDMPGYTDEINACLGGSAGGCIWNWAEHDGMNRYQVSRYLGRRRKTNLKDFPQVACFAFDSISSQIMIDGQYEANLLSFLHSRVFPTLDRRRLCLDIGANIGNHSLSFARDFQRVFSFEPNERVFQLLRFNAEIPGNITPYQIGASDKQQQLPAYVWASNLGGATVETSHAERTTKRGEHTRYVFKLDRLDDLIAADDKRQVDFMKVDVEGHELQALTGALGILRLAQPVIAFEILRTGLVQGKSKVINLLKDNGYQYFYEISTSLGLPGGLNRVATKILPDSMLQSMVKTSVQRVENLDDKNYPMLLASCRELAL